MGIYVPTRSPLAGGGCAPCRRDPATEREWRHQRGQGSVDADGYYVIRDWGRYAAVQGVGGYLPTSTALAPQATAKPPFGSLRGLGADVVAAAPVSEAVVTEVARQTGESAATVRPFVVSAARMAQFRSGIAPARLAIHEVLDVRKKGQLVRASERPSSEIATADVVPKEDAPPGEKKSNWLVWLTAAGIAAKIVF